MAIGGIVSGSLAYKNNKEALGDQRAANADLTRRMTAGQRDYQAQRPQAQLDRAKALQTQLGLLKPANAMLGEMSGGRYGLDFSAIPQQSPVSMKPLASQGKPTGNGTYDYTAVSQLRDQGYDVSGVPISQTSRPVSETGSFGDVRRPMRRGKKDGK
jgi:hypothetical protein